MVNENAYFEAMDKALASLCFEPWDRDSNDFTNFFWGLITRAYMELVQPVVSCLPRQASVFVGEGITSWGRGEISCLEEVNSRAQKRYTNWFNSHFMASWHRAGLVCRSMLSRELEDYINKYLVSRSLPGVRLDMFRLHEVLKPLENNLREKALPFMLHEIFSYEFAALDDEIGDRQLQLEEGRGVLRDERDFRIGIERIAINETLVTEDLIFAFAGQVYNELFTALNKHKAGCVSGYN